MKNISFISILICFIFAACEKNQPDSTLTYVPVQGFEDLEEGDVFYYELFLAEDYFDDNNSNYEILADTLVLEVCNIVEEGRYVISEKISENSAVHSSSDNYYFGADSIYTNYWTIRNDSLFLEEKSHDYFQSHLFHNSQPNLDLQNFDENQTQLFGWKIVENSIEFSSTYFVENGVIGNNNYPHINVVVNNAGMAADGPGFMFLYNRDDGILRTSTYSAWTGMGYGWERIKE